MNKPLPPLRPVTPPTPVMDRNKVAISKNGCRIIIDVDSLLDFQCAGWKSEVDLKQAAEAKINLAKELNRKCVPTI